MITRLLTILACLLALLPAGALRALELQGPLVQGGTVLGRVAPGTPVTLDGRRVRVSGEGVFVIGFDRDSPATHTLVAGPEKRTLAIKPRTYDIQKVTGIAQRIMEPTKADLERIARERKTPFVAFRVISDDLSKDLPPEVLSIVGATGSVRLGAALAAIFKRPASVLDLWTLREQANAAADRLSN
jgi:hypothetical protein